MPSGTPSPIPILSLVGRPEAGDGDAEALNEVAGVVVEVELAADVAERVTELVDDIEVEELELVRGVVVRLTK